MVTSPIELVGWSSNSGVHDVPWFSVFQRPPTPSPGRTPAGEPPRRRDPRSAPHEGRTDLPVVELGNGGLERHLGAPGQRGDQGQDDDGEREARKLHRNPRQRVESSRHLTIHRRPLASGPDASGRRVVRPRSDTDRPSVAFGHDRPGHAHFGGLEEPERPALGRRRVLDVPANVGRRNRERIPGTERVLLEQGEIEVERLPGKRDLTDLDVLSRKQGDLVVGLVGDDFLPVVELVLADQVERVSGIGQQFVFARRRSAPTGNSSPRPPGPCSRSWPGTPPPR